jgi:hypothetical protein
MAEEYCLEASKLEQALAAKMKPGFVADCSAAAEALIAQP